MYNILQCNVLFASGHAKKCHCCADLSETRVAPSGLYRRAGRRHGSPTKSGRIRVVEFGRSRLSPGEG